MQAITSSVSSSGVARLLDARDDLKFDESLDIIEAAEQVVREYEAKQEPRINVVPEGAVYTDGPDAVLLCSTYWFTPDKWQSDLLDAWLSRDADGNLLAITIGLSVPRQNGKNGAIEGYTVSCNSFCRRYP